MSNMQEFRILVRNCSSSEERIAALHTRLYFDFVEMSYEGYAVEEDYAFGFMAPLYVVPVPSRNYIRIYGSIHGPFQHNHIQGAIVLKLTFSLQTEQWTMPSLWEHNIIRDSMGQSLPVLVVPWDFSISTEGLSVPEFRVVPFPTPRRDDEQN